MLNGLVYVTGTISPTALEELDDFEDFDDLDDLLDPGLYNESTFICAVDPATRRIRWQRTFDNMTIGMSSLRVPSSGSRLLWVTNNPDGNSGREIAGLDAGGDGRALWEQPAPGSGAHHAGPPDSLHVPWHDGPRSWAGGRFLYLADRLYAVEPDSGQIAWRSPDPVTYQAVSASPDGATVYAAAIGLNEAFVYAHDARTGTVRWAGTLPSMASGQLALQCADDQVYLWANGVVWALDPDDGRARWSYEFTGGSASWTESVPLWAGGGLVCGPTNGGLLALAADGT